MSGPVAFVSMLLPQFVTTGFLSTIRSLVGGGSRLITSGLTNTVASIGRIRQFGVGKLVPVQMGKDVIKVGGRIIGGVPSSVMRTINKGAVNTRNIYYREKGVLTVIRSAFSRSGILMLPGAVLTVLLVVFPSAFGALWDIIRTILLSVFLVITDSILAVRLLVAESGQVNSFPKRKERNIITVLEWAILFTIDKLLFFFFELVLLAQALLDVAFTGITFLFKQWWLPVALIIAIVISSPFEHEPEAWMDTANNVGVALESFLQQGSTVGNVLLDVNDAISPILNEQVISTVAQWKMLCDVFCPDEIETAAAEARGRSLQSNAANGQGVRKRIGTFKEGTMKMAFANHIVNKVQLSIFGLYMVLFKFVYEYIGDVVEITMSKLGCMFMAPAECVFKEFAHLLVLGLYRAVEPVLNFFGIDAPPQIACAAGELSMVSVEECKGPMYSIEPKGAFYINLDSTVVNGANGRRRLDEENVLTCEKHPHDNSWVEKLNGKVIHVSHVNKCPLSRHVFRDELSNVHQFNILDIDKECYQVCLAGVSYSSCHSKEAGHSRHLLGSCDPNVQVKSETQARRRLSSLFPDHLFSWTSSNIETEPKQSKPDVNGIDGMFGQNAADSFEQSLFNRAGTSEDITKNIEDFIGKSNKFTVYGIKCTIVTKDPNPFQMLTNMICYGLKLSTIAKIDVRGWIDDMFYNHQSTVKSYFNGGSASTRRVNRRNLKSDDVMWKRDMILMRSNKLITALKDVRKSLRLLQATDKKLSVSRRLDDMINLSYYQPEPKRRVLQLDENDQFVVMKPEKRMKDIGWCDGNGMYPCYTGECVPIEQRELCPLPDDDPDVSFTGRIWSYLHQASLIKVDVEEKYQESVECYRTYEEKPYTVPLSMSNMRTDKNTTLYCFGTRAPNPFRFPNVELMGVNRLIGDMCKGPDGTNECGCFFYMRTGVSYSATAFAFMDMDTVYKFYNFGITCQFILSWVLFAFFPFTLLQSVWYSFLSLFGINVIPAGILYLFSDMGLSNVTTGTKIMCMLFHLHSFFSVILIIFLFVCYVNALIPLFYWYWTFIGRSTYLIFTPGVKDSSGKEASDVIMKVYRKIPSRKKRKKLEEKAENQV